MTSPTRFSGMWASGTRMESRRASSVCVLATEYVLTQLDLFPQTRVETRSSSPLLLSGLRPVPGASATRAHAGSLHMTPQRTANWRLFWLDIWISRTLAGVRATRHGSAHVEMLRTWAHIVPVAPDARACGFSRLVMPFGVRRCLGGGAIARGTRSTRCSCGTRTSCETCGVNWTRNITAGCCPLPMDSTGRQVCPRLRDRSAGFVPVFVPVSDPLSVTVPLHGMCLCLRLCQCLCLCMCLYL